MDQVSCYSNVMRFDEFIEAKFDAIRRMEIFDTQALALSNVGDYGLIWAVIAALKITSGPLDMRPRAKTIATKLAASGLVSYVTNKAAKAVVGRERPNFEGKEIVEENSKVEGKESRDLRAMLREPSSSSFPSGHSLAAFCTAVVLADSSLERVGYLALASGIGASRIYVRAHHGSDVVGGAAIGLAAGWMVNLILAS